MYGLSLNDIPHAVDPLIAAFSWGELCHCAHLPETYSLDQYTLLEGEQIPFHFYLTRKGTYYVEHGTLLLHLFNKEGKVDTVLLTPGNTFPCMPGQVHSFEAKEKATFYFFTNGGAFSDAQTLVDCSVPERTIRPCENKWFDEKEKYWGSIATIVDDEYAGKRIVMKKNTQSSLEFHCSKTESYFLQSGLLRIGIRYGRSENSSIVLKPGQAFTIFPGLMHMRIAEEDLILLEISTRDSDSDSYLVEDGKRYQHKEHL